MSKTFFSVSLGRPVAILTAVCFAALALPLSFSAGALATPAIGRELAGGPVELNWITNAFMLTFGSLLMAAGALADRFGRKRLFAIGVSGFTLVSLLLGFAPSILVVDLLRAMQGVHRRVQSFARGFDCRYAAVRNCGIRDSWPHSRRRRFVCESREARARDDE
jgi:MFS family permease